MRRGLHWFRQDLRLADNTALRELEARCDEWLPVYVLDPRLIDAKRSRTARARFLLDCLGRLAGDLADKGIPLVVRRGRPETVVPRLLGQTRATLLSFNAGTTPFAVRRDAAVRHAVERQGVDVIERLDHVVLPPDRVRTKQGAPFRVYTPYRHEWWRVWRGAPPLPAPRPRLPRPIPGVDAKSAALARLVAPGPVASKLPTGGERAARRRLDAFLDRAVERYAVERDLPAVDGTSRLSPYLRFGTISARECIARALVAAEQRPALDTGVRKWLDELVWREFFHQIVREQPRVLRESQRREFASLRWRRDEAGFAAWCAGRTGFPIVDAGMRQLRDRGWMHNRVRMITASFLTKDLLIDWRLGERWFMDHLVDGDPASNNGGWQWAASTGTDAQPWFRIFNPTTQGRRYDPDGRYVRRWIPELRDVPTDCIHTPHQGEATVNYPRPIVDHAESRARALAAFRAAKGS